MSKVLTFSRTFPSYHPKKGQPTFFVEKIWAGLADKTDWTMPSLEMDFHEYYNCKHPKWHTIRAGHRFKVGDKFSPRVWSGKPYASKQIIIAPDIEIKKVWDFCIDPLGGEYRMDGFEIPFGKLKDIAANDGFDELDDFELWFNTKRGFGFSGQIICWNDSIE